MRNLFLHIGTHKTGTTSFQAYLVDKSEQFRRSGVAVCTERHKKFGLVANCFSVPNSVLRPGLMTVARMTGDAKTSGFWQRARSKAHIAKFLSDRDAKHFILSAEAFCFAREEGELIEIKKLFGDSDIEVTPVVCLRNDEAWRESWLSEIHEWEQKCRHSHGEGLGDIRGDWYFDKSAILHFWQRVGNVRTVDFDEAVGKRGTVIPSLLEAMELEDVGGSDQYFLRARH